MGVNWAAGLIRWRPHTSSDGRTYPLAHVHPFRFTCELGGSAGYSPRTITINVGFSLHVFTCALADARTGADEYSDDRECRAFDHDRYRASLRLGALVRALENRKCYFASKENFVTIDAADAPADHEYRVFFSVRADKNSVDTVTLIVQSAYFRRVDWGRGDLPRKSVAFRVILSNTLAGKRVRVPPR